MKTPASLQLFVYSSLRKGFHSEDYQYLTKFFSFVSLAKVKGILRDFGTDPVAIPTEEDSFIKGELYILNKMDDFSWVFGQLDDYEGLDATNEEPILYRRELTTVYKEDNSITDAWIYWFNSDNNKTSVTDSENILEDQKNNNS